MYDSLGGHATLHPELTHGTTITKTTTTGGTTHRPLNALSSTMVRGRRHNKTNHPISFPRRLGSLYYDVWWGFRFSFAFFKH